MIAIPTANPIMNSPHRVETPFSGIRLVPVTALAKSATPEAAAKDRSTMPRALKIS